jgi:hypothetical protein
MATGSKTTRKDACTGDELFLNMHIIYKSTNAVAKQWLIASFHIIKRLNTLKQVASSIDCRTACTLSIMYESYPAPSTGCRPMVVVEIVEVETDLRYVSSHDQECIPVY